ncbi:MAG: DUF3656 domain-containing protein [Polyangiaceae bacterium]
MSSASTQTVSAVVPPVRPEVLAPAGDDAAMRAAVRAGADAVYFGLQGFNARARATNFDIDGLSKTLQFLHEHGVRGYVTLNTLVFDSELGAVEAAIRACAAAGVDAVIVQDLGVARLVREIAPSMPIHASTQMTCTDAASVALAHELGASRVILARELSVTEIAAIHEQTRSSGVELEVFVHGALCISYSGQCLTSEAIGGRSANRGACAQACRLPYELVVDGELRDLGDKAYLLSPEDLEGSSMVPGLIEAGVRSLKIEGRLKGPDYVAATTALYRHAIDAAMGVREPLDERERRSALQTYSRGSGAGFLAGVNHQRLVEGRACDHRGVLAGQCTGITRARGKTFLEITTETPMSRGDGILVEGGFASEGEVGGRIWSIAVGGAEKESVQAGQRVSVWLGPERRIESDELVGRRVWKTDDPANQKEILQRIEQAPQKQPIDIVVTGELGKPPRFEASSALGKVCIDGELLLELARTTPTNVEVLKEKLGQLGDTPFVLHGLESKLPDGVLIPLSSLKKAKRALVDALLARSRVSCSTTTSTWQSVEAALTPHELKPLDAGLYVLCRTLPQAEAALDAGASGVYLDFLELTGLGAAVRALRQRDKTPYIAVAPPRIRKPGEEKIDRYLASLEPDAVLVRGLGALYEGAQSPSEVPRIGDFSLNITNRISATEVLSRGLRAFTPSFDLDASQLVSLLSTPSLAGYAEVVLHHPMPLFHMEHCVIAALLSSGKDHLSCGRPCEKHQLSLRDRAGLDHPVEADVGCRNTVFHAAAQSAAGLVSSLQQSGVGRFRIELVRESRDDVTRIVQTYTRLLRGQTSAADVWRTLRTEGGYGVVRGSLRVLHGG